MSSKYDKDVRARALRLVREHSGDYPTERVAITAVSSRLGMSSEVLRKWLRQAEVDEGKGRWTSSARCSRSARSGRRPASATGR